ncbi:MAG: 6-bladed beta-propeller [Balneola sp.]
MNKFVFIVILSIFLSFLYSCSKTSSENTTNYQVITNPEYGIWQERETPQVEFELVQLFGEENAPEEELLGGITAMFTDDDQNVYVLDDRLSKLISFDKNGEVRWVTGSKGRGPGDFENAWNMIWDGNETIYVSNIARTRIGLFNLKGEFLKTLSITNEELKTVNLNGFIGDKIVVSKSISGSFLTKFILFNPADPDSILSSFSVDLTGDLKIPQGLSWLAKAWTLDDQLVVADISNYSFSFYNSDNMKTQQLDRNFDRIMRPGFYQNGNNKAMGSMGGLNTIVKLGNEYYITTASWPTNVDDPDQYMKNYGSEKQTNAEFSNTTDLFDQDFQLLYSIESDGFINEKLGLIEHSDNENYVYARSNTPYPHIKKYRLVVSN